MKPNKKFIFDLDGTITAKETLPIISRHFGITEDIEKLTKETVEGNIPFIESFIRRVHILGKLPVENVATLLSKVPLHKNVCDFIRVHREICAISTGNLDCWVQQLVTSLGCELFSSKAEIEQGVIYKLTKILRKEDVVRSFKEQGYEVIFIGDGNNDVEAMREADISIASGLTHQPVKSVLTIADYAVYTEKSLCRLLNQLL